MARTRWALAVLVLTAAVAAGFVIAKRRSQPSAGISGSAPPSATLARGGELVALYRD